MSSSLRRRRRSRFVVVVRRSKSSAVPGRRGAPAGLGVGLALDERVGDDGRSALQEVKELGVSESSRNGAMRMESGETASSLSPPWLVALSSPNASFFNRSLFPPSSCALYSNSILGAHGGFRDAQVCTLSATRERVFKELGAQKRVKVIRERRVLCRPFSTSTSRKKSKEKNRLSLSFRPLSLFLSL